MKKRFPLAVRPCLAVMLLSASVAALLTGVARASGDEAVRTDSILHTDYDPLAYGSTTELAGSGQKAASPDGMVVSAQHLASEAGAQILRQGGNAVDAAVAVGYALAVVYPAAGNLGGGGFMTIYPGHGNTNPGPGDLRHGRTVFMDFRERAPAAARPDMYLDQQGNIISGASTKGWKAVAVPGTVAGLEGVRERWGHLSREQDMAPAIALAEQGFILQQGDIELLNTSTVYFQQDPYARNIFLRLNGSTLQVGDRLVQHDLARSLKLIARDGADAFYNGPIGHEILRESRKSGGLLSSQDFSDYQIRLSAPLRCHYRGYEIHTAPLPSGGGVALCEMLNILQGYDMAALGLHSAVSVQHEIEAMRHAYSDRRSLGDPAFIANVRGDVAHFTDPAYAEEIREALPSDHALPSSLLKMGVPVLAAPEAKERTPGHDVVHEKHETTQFSVMDKDGMAVSVTYTLDGWFGARVMGGKTGIWMNDEMDDFAIKPGAPNMFGITGSTANAIAPGKTPLSSMAPTILTKDGRVVMVTGSPGGSRIPTIILSTILGVVDYGLDIGQAVALPRIHEQWMPEGVEVEPSALSDSVIRRLREEGYEIVPHQPWGIVEAILVGTADRKTLAAGKTTTGGAGRMLYGSADPRHLGGAAIGQ